jgi:hypothetical protein
MNRGNQSICTADLAIADAKRMMQAHSYSHDHVHEYIDECVKNAEDRVMIQEGKQHMKSWFMSVIQIRQFKSDGSDPY